MPQTHDRTTSGRAREVLTGASVVLQVFVLDQGQRPSKGLATGAAHKGLLQRVRLLVPFQGVLCGEGLGTRGVVGAGKGPLALALERLLWLLACVRPFDMRGGRVDKLII